jgi:hypothetical protein
MWCSKVKKQAFIENTEEQYFFFPKRVVMKMNSESFTNFIHTIDSTPLCPLKLGAGQFKNCGRRSKIWGHGEDVRFD